METINKINSVSDKTPDASGEITIFNCNFNRNDNFMRSFLSISFSNHCLIIRMIKSLDERIYYTNKSAENHLSYRQLEELIESDDLTIEANLLDWSTRAIHFILFKTGLETKAPLNILDIGK